jgi:hypothetical protein
VHVKVGLTQTSLQIAAMPYFGMYAPTEKPFGWPLCPFMLELGVDS